jgi:hypothetical protein
MICSTLCLFFMGSTGVIPQNSHSNLSSFTGLDQEHLEIEITSEEVRVGQTIIDHAGWEVSLFRDPATAPQKLRFSASGDVEVERGARPDLQMRMSF